MALKRVMIFIDGSNLYHNLREHCKRTDLNFEKFARKLAREERELLRTYYYNAPVDGNKEPQRSKEQQRFLANLEKIPDFQIEFGRLQLKSDGRKVEKGVDVKLAVDMLTKGYKDQYDVAILVSGDADFVKVAEEVKDLGKHIELGFFTGQKCFHLKKTVDRRIELTPDFLLDCWVKG